MPKEKKWWAIEVHEAKEVLDQDDYDRLIDIIHRVRKRTDEDYGNPIVVQKDDFMYGPVSSLLSAYDRSMSDADGSVYIPPDSELGPGPSLPIQLEATEPMPHTMMVVNFMGTVKNVHLSQTTMPQIEYEGDGGDL